MGIIAIATGLQQLIAEGWTRYFILVGGVSLADNVTGGLIGIFPLKSLIETVVHVWIPEFYFPVFYADGVPVSSLLIIVVIMPVFLFIFKKTSNIAQSN